MDAGTSKPKASTRVAVTTIGLNILGAALRSALACAIAAVGSSRLANVCSRNRVGRNRGGMVGIGGSRLLNSVLLGMVRQDVRVRPSRSTLRRSAA